MAIKSVTQFLREVEGELSKVVWPKFNEFLGATIVVLILVFISSIYLGLIDFGLSKLARLIFKYYSGY